MLKLYYIFSIVIFFSALDAARILAVFPVPYLSHQIIFRIFTQELVKRGHEVVVITTDPAFNAVDAPPNLTEIDVHDVSHTLWRERKTCEAEIKNKKKCVLETDFEIMMKIVYKQLNAEAVQKLIKEEAGNFDLLILEACVRQALVYSHVFKAPLIQVSTLGGFNGNYEDLGAPSHSLLYPMFLQQRVYNLSLWDKIKELYDHYTMERIFSNRRNIEDAYAKEYFGLNIPPIDILAENIDMLFLNTHRIWDVNRPVPPAIRHIGLCKEQEKELPEDLKRYLDSSKNGIIYISFGTSFNISTLAPEKVQTLVKVFSQLPYDILWRWDKEELPGRSKNIRISKWLPQSILLTHPNIKLFITQGGLHSTEEGLAAGVPFIGIPLVNDQWYNVEQYTHHGIGQMVDIDTLTEEALMTAIRNNMNDESYHRNSIRLGAMMHDQPQSPLQRAVWWTEYVLRHGGAKHLRGSAANISWSEYLELELVFLVLVAVIISICLMCLCLHYIVKGILKMCAVIIKLKQY